MPFHPRLADHFGFEMESIKEERRVDPRTYLPKETDDWYNALALFALAERCEDKTRQLRLHQALLAFTKFGR